ncbi:type I-E CRISPR-associated protein Cse2/CasB [Streptomyces sp. BBFR2]|uniref:type I-E CRISPR-associated protein Cse2/CasB n=1 Tax=Streptomyces sp. BBFR2 TaxID=3372854 RepID=UPI0037DA4C79
MGRTIAACRRDAGTGQAIRSALGHTPAEAVRAHRYVAARLPDEPAADLEWAHYTVAALIALYDPRAKPAKDLPSDEGDDDGAAQDTGQGEHERGKRRKQPLPLSRRLRQGNLGAVLGALDAPDTSGEDPEGRSAPRLQALFREDLAGLHTALPGVMRLACDAPRLPDWGVLLHDIADWERDKRREAAVLRWSSAYYKTLTTGAANSDADAEHESEKN